MTTIQTAAAIARDLCRLHVGDARHAQTVSQLIDVIYGYDHADRRSYLMPSGRRSTSEAKALAAWREAA